MGGRVVAALVVGAMMVTSLPAAGQETTEVPAVVQIEDPAGDANYLNGQGFQPDQGDHTTPADLTISDILKVWFTNDAKNISANIQTEAPPPSGNASYIYRVMFNPGDNASGCLWFEAIVEGPGYVGESFARLRPVCADVDPIDAELAITTGPDETGVITVTIARSADPAFATGAVIAAPRAEVRNNWGAEAAGRATAPTVDDTVAGTDYTVTSGKAAKAKKAGCKKGGARAKKKGCKRR